MNFFKTPLDTFYNLKMYREVQTRSLGRAFLYLLYLSAIVTVLFVLLLVTQIVPLADDFVGWFKQDMPSIVWTPAGVSIRETTPYTMFHPEFGPLLIFETDKQNLDLSALEAPVHVTSNKAYVNRGGGEYRIYDLIGPALEDQFESDAVAIGPEFVQRYYDLVKPWGYALSFLVYLPSIFVWKVIAGLFYALMALILNQTRRVKLEFGTIYIVCLYAMTPAVLIGAILPMIPGLNRLPFGLLGSLLVTAVYLFLAIKKSEIIEPPVTPSE